MPNAKSFLSNLIKPFKSISGNSGNTQDEDLEKIAAEEQRVFSFRNLAHATKDFHVSNKLGEGGFGPVYKGILSDGREVAVKKLSRTSNQGKKQFVNEARLLSGVQHRNVVSLLGYCAHGDEKLLVYEYLPHQSIDKILFNSKRRDELDWKKRYNVIVGVARGLLYLHEDSHICIIHRDIKASNILLDDKWDPKIADFGMARLFPEDQTHINTRVSGTRGYMAPEYVMHGQLSVKADVYSYGVLVLEMISGHNNNTFNVDTDSHDLLDWAWKLYKKGWSLEILDESVVLKPCMEEMAMCVKIGLLCTQADPKLRPNMRRVLVMLSKKSAVLEEPTRPGYPGYRFRRIQRPASSSSTAAGSSFTPGVTSSMTSSSGEFSQGFVSTLSTMPSTTSTIDVPTQKSHDKRPVQE